MNGTAEQVRELRQQIAVLEARKDLIRRGLLAFAGVVGLVVVFAMATAAIEVQRFAVHAGFAVTSSWLLDPVVGVALLVALFGELLVANFGEEPPRAAAAVRHFAGVTTLAMNCWPSYSAGRWDGVLLHSVMPGLLILFAWAAPGFFKALGRVLAQADLGLTQSRDRIRELQAAAEQERRQADREAHLARQQAARQQAEEQQRAVDQAAAREREAADLRIAEAERIAALEREQAESAARWELQQIEARSAARLAEIAAQSANRRQSEFANRVPAAAAASSRTQSANSAGKAAPSKEDAVQILRDAMAAHEGETEWAMDWEALSADHGGGKTFWYAALKEARAPHLVGAAAG